jgi:hypothetical protein
MRSHYTDANGRALQQRGQMDQLIFETTDQSPFERRWGGWYVTGTHGSMRHMGNIHGATDVSHISDPVSYTRTFDLNAGANLTTVAPLIERAPYLTLDRDIVALLVLGHQVTVENEIVSLMRVLRASGTTATAQETRDRALAVERLAAALTFNGGRLFPLRCAGQPISDACSRPPAFAIVATEACAISTSRAGSSSIRSATCCIHRHSTRCRLRFWKKCMGGSPLF